MFTLVALLIIICCIMLTLVVLAQSSKGDGLSGALGAPGGAAATFGVRRASDFLQKATMYLGGAFVILCIIANLFFLPNGNAGPSAVQTGRAVVPSAPSNRMPSSAPAASQPAAQQPAGAQPGTGQTNPDNSPMK